MSDPPSSEPADTPSPWPSLQARYGRKLRRKQLVQAAIRAEVPGGPELLEAVRLVHEALPTGEEKHQKAAERLFAAVLEAADAGLHDFAHALSAARYYAQGVEHLRGDPLAEDVHGVLIERVDACRDLAAEMVLEKYRQG